MLDEHVEQTDRDRRDLRHRLFDRGGDQMKASGVWMQPDGCLVPVSHCALADIRVTGIGLRG